MIRGRDFCFAASRCRPAMRTSTPNTLVLLGLGFRPAVTLAGCLLAFYCMDLPAPPWASGAGGGRDHASGVSPSSFQMSTSRNG